MKDQIDKIINEIEKNEMLKNIIITDQTVDKIHINIIIDNVKNVIKIKINEIIVLKIIEIKNEIEINEEDIKNKKCHEIVMLE